MNDAIVYPLGNKLCISIIYNLLPNGYTIASFIE